MLEERQDELRVHKDEIKLLKLTIDNYETKVNEQADLIEKLEKELTNVKGESPVYHSCIKGPILSSMSKI